METDGKTKTLCEELPVDYQNWSSIVIYFQEQFDCIDVYALDCDNNRKYYVLSYERPSYFYKIMGYTAGDFKLYFVGNDSECDEDSEFRTVDAYDIRTREWISAFPKLLSPKPTPFVFFFDGCLYVFAHPMGPSFFEKLNVSNLSKGWVLVPAPPPVLRFYTISGGRSVSYDYSNKIMHIRSDLRNFISCYDWKYNRWDFNETGPTLLGRMGHSFNVRWWKSYVILENHLYQFKMKSPVTTISREEKETVYYPKLRPTLAIHNLEHDMEVHDNARVKRKCNVDISSIVSPDVGLDENADGYLIYLGKRNSCPSFCLLIVYDCESCYETVHVSTSTFYLSRSSTNVGESSTNVPFTVNLISSSFQHEEVLSSLCVCKKLCEVKDD